MVVKEFLVLSMLQVVLQLVIKYLMKKLGETATFTEPTIRMYSVTFNVNDDLSIGYNHV